MGFESFQRGQQVSASALRALQATVNNSRPTLGGGVSKRVTSGGTSAVFDDMGWFLAKITAVTGTGATATYSFTEQMIEAHVGDVIDRGSPRMADKDTNPGRCVLASHTLALDDLCLARRAVGPPNEWELLPVGAGGETWRAGYVTARSAGPPISYTVQPVKLDAGGLYVADGSTVSPCYRMQSALYDEADLLPIPTDEGGQGVLWREDPEQAGKYQMSPWGGQWKVIKNELIFTCTRCVETSPGLFQNVTSLVYRYLAHFGRDFRVTWKEAGTAEGPIEDDLFETP